MITATDTAIATIIEVFLVRYFITGGSGFVGRYLTDVLLGDGHEVMVLTRSATGRPGRPGLTWVEGDPTVEGDWQSLAGGADVCVNLAGASIFGRWTDDYKRRMQDSRILTTRNLVAGMAGGSDGKVLISTSAVGFYGFLGDEAVDEAAPPGDDFLAALCRDWEAEAYRAAERGVRVVITRFGIVLGKRGGALAQILRPFKFFMGGKLGSGRQWFSWIHQDDLCRAISFLATQGGVEGPFNLTAPQAVTNRHLAKAVGRVLHRPSFMPTPGFVLRMVLGEFGSVLLEGQRVIPDKLIKAGFEFKYPGLDTALTDLLA